MSGMNRENNGSQTLRGMYRLSEQGRVMGVCAGLADYFGWNVTVVRLSVVIALLLFFFPVVVAYFLAGLILPDRTGPLYEDSSAEEFWRRVRRSPRDTLSGARYRFLELEKRLRRMEAYVTSNEFGLDKELDGFRDK